MNIRTRYMLALEFVSWLLTIGVVVGVMLPIYLSGISFPFFLSNVVYIILFITFARLTFLLRHSWLQAYSYVKIGLIACSVILVVSLINWLFRFNQFVDEQGLHSITYHLPYKDQQALNSYIQSEYLFFGVGAIIAAIIFPIRLFISVWRDYNPTS